MILSTASFRKRFWGCLIGKKNQPLSSGLKLQYFGHLMRRVDSLEKTLMLGGIGAGGEGTTEDEMAEWHHWLDGHESEWTPGVGEGQGGLACCDSWGRKESDTTERLNWTELIWSLEKLKTLPKLLSSHHQGINLRSMAAAEGIRIKGSRKW